MALASVRRSSRVVQAVRETPERLRYLAQAVDKWNPDPRAEAFVAAYRSARIDPDLVFYEAYSGVAMACGPEAIFRELLIDPRYAHLKHVWSLDDAEEIERRTREFAGHPNVRFILDNSPSYFETLTTAKYLIQNTTFRAYFTKRPEQVYLNTWHSAGAVKTMGFDLPDGNYHARNTLRNFLATDFISAPNSLMTRLFTESFRLRGLYDGTLLQFGYPRHDTTLKTPRAEVIEELRQRGVAVDPDRKIILHAPTFRGLVGNVRGNAAELEELRTALTAGIDTEEYQVLVKPHGFHYGLLSSEQRLSGRYIPRQVGADRLLAAVDILVSDYSSIFFDFMVTGRPVLFYVPDLADYAAERGLYFAPEDLPGPVTTDAGQVAGWINDLDGTTARYAERYAQLRAQACGDDDGQASRRTVDAVFGGRRLEGMVGDLVDPARKRVLIHASDLDDSGVTEALLALVAGLDPLRYDVSVCGIGPSDASRRNVARIERARVLARIGIPATNQQERYGLEHLQRYGTEGLLARVLPTTSVLQREWRRCFGDAQFDVVVDFSAYPGRFARMVVAAGQKLVIRQHTEVPANLRNRAKWRLSEDKAPPVTKPALAGLYGAADLVVVPSPGLLEANRKAFPRAAGKFRPAASLVDPRRVERLLAEAAAWQVDAKPSSFVADSAVGADGSHRILQLPATAPVPESGEPYRRFVTMGRLSPEKNLAHLIEAFAGFLTDHPNSRLFIVGEGPAEPELRKVADRPDLTTRVCFTGYLPNPFTVLSQADCYVLPSRYEGFNLGLMEARMLGLSVILSGFAAAPGVSLPGGQLVTGFGVTELAAALEAFAQGRVPRVAFDATVHNAAALAQWEELLDSL